VNLLLDSGLQGRIMDFDVHGSFRCSSPYAIHCRRMDADRTAQSAGPAVTIRK
jgi:hypothetical protein